MKYTEEQKKKLKKKDMQRFHKCNSFIPTIIIKDGFFIVESKINGK
jgi:hypothetical protein